MRKRSKQPQWEVHDGQRLGTHPGLKTGSCGCFISLFIWIMPQQNDQLLCNLDLQVVACLLKHVVLLYDTYNNLSNSLGPMLHSKAFRAHYCVMRTTSKPVKKRKPGKAQVILQPCHILSLHLGNTIIFAYICHAFDDFFKSSLSCSANIIFLVYKFWS